MSSLATNYHMESVYYASLPNTANFQSRAKIFEDKCVCSNLRGCPRPVSIFDLNTKSIETNVTGMIFDCLLVDGVLASSLDCFYQSSCLSLLQNEAIIPIGVQPLNASSRFTQTTTIEQLLSELMIEELTKKINFLRYYTECDPVFCTYSYTSQALVNQCQKLITIIRSKIHNLNLFKTAFANDDTVRRQHITSWVYITCISFSLLILSSYWLLSSKMKIVTISNPSLADYNRLWMIHSHNLECPCSQIFIPHLDFIHIEPVFHQVCSSKITSPNWYRNLEIADNIRTGDESTFEISLGIDYFRALDAFCSLVENFTVDAYRIFSSKIFISSHALPDLFFSNEIVTLIDTFTESTTVRFARIFDFTRNIIQTDQLASRTFSNFLLQAGADGTLMLTEKFQRMPSAHFPIVVRFSCSCLSIGPECGSYAFISNSNTSRNFFINRYLFNRCLLTDSVLSSALECWYNASCFNPVEDAYAQAGIFNKFDGILNDRNISSRFPMNRDFGTMLNELLIEDWISNVSYNNYFDKCAPLSCSFTIEQKFDWFFVFANILGLYGGLSVGLKLILPVIVSLILLTLRQISNRFRIRPDCQLAQTNENVKSNTPILSYKERLMQYLLNYNLFKTPYSTNASRSKELLSTRIFIVVSIIMAVTIIFYGGFSEQMKNKTIHIPSQPSYENFQRLYSDSLQCPCSNISFSYNTFVLHLNAIFHPVCSSILISDTWMTDFNYRGKYSPQWFPPQEFHRWGILFFKLLSSLCSISNSTIIDAIKEFRFKTFVSTVVVPKIQFELQINETIRVFQKSMETQVSRVLQLFRANAQGNGFISAIGTNLLLSYVPNGINASIIYTPKSYNNATCSCATSSLCVEPAFFNYENGTLSYTLENIFMSCFIVDSILLSSLRCFFSDSCTADFKNGYISDIDSPFDVNNSLLGPYKTFPILTLSENSRYTMNDTIEMIVNNFFIDIWSSEISYEQYYNACAPIYCTYRYGERFNVLFTLTIFLTLFSRLSAGLRMIVPFSVKLVYKFLSFISQCR
ncbi:unnamed protein product [Rotaria sp. Silwood1]|nr:unnamed protein product [Rotaria sp. Silwood1]